ncbi:MAG: hypothetical protein LBN00_05015 [Oscillospiraceae bacterium]|jgi:hypothetical protein|nr:hypothetical protein [Oscillospiraceae bacterium]
MKTAEIRNFNDFCAALINAGFSLGGGNDEGIFAVVPFSWDERPPYETPVRWHTGDAETDPWEWRVRVLTERSDVAYGKVFFNKSGFITREWYPYFLAARRGDGNLSEHYYDGHVSQTAKQIFELIAGSEHGALPVEEIKRLGHFAKEDKSRFDRALTELQTGLFVTMCGTNRRVNAKGEEYGWNSMMYCTTESFWGGEVFNQAAELAQDAAVAAITAQILRLNPGAEPKKITRFINAAK